MSKKLFQLVAALSITTAMIPGLLFTAESFYEGKIVNIIVGLSAGGGCDLYARTIARHLGKHIPGHPTLIVSNMPGAGSMVAANQLYKAIKPVSGYNETAEIRLVVESGELDGVCLTWDSAATTWRKGLDTGDIILIQQAVPKALPQLPNVSLAINLAKTDEGRKLIEAGLHKTFVFSRPLVLPLGTLKDRVEILRNAFRETLMDKELFEETKASKLGFNPVNGDDLETAIKGFFKTNRAILDKVKELIYRT